MFLWSRCIRYFDKSLVVSASSYSSKKFLTHSKSLFGNWKSTNMTLKFPSTLNPKIMQGKDRYNTESIIERMLNVLMLKTGNFLGEFATIRYQTDIRARYPNRGKVFGCRNAVSLFYSCLDFLLCVYGAMLNLNCRMDSDWCVNTMDRLPSIIYQDPGCRLT